ncbi:GGDEF domain-containing protein [Thiomicrorhabdus sp. Kp2]|uniref:GGDEF domain-containing protein n=1 Tax=Thiomicrorhabdus sp. Kp2 TaxID=1123518 RepID=UPI000423107F|nr:GGDEF domain-containing protein [Thiomicrorhabdus sp. Kp2]
MFLKNIFKESFWLKLVVSWVDEEDSHIFSRALFAHAILLVMGLLMAFFTLYHFLYTGNYKVGFFDLVALLFVIFLYFQLRTNKSIKLVGHFLAIGTSIIYLMFILITQNKDMSLIWVVFLPFFIILLNGWKVGGLYVFAFYIVVFPLAYFNIGVWDDGLWNYVNFYRFVATLLLAMSMAVLIDLTQVYSYKRELKMHEKELLYLDELKIMSRTDGLTGLYNRHYFNQIFAQKIKELESAQHSLMFFIVDIDNFKAYNDFYGHQAGDEVIQQIGAAIQKFIHRENDLVFRLGGEEFAGLLEARDPKQMACWLTQLSGVIESLKLKHAPGLDLPWVTISGGISSMSPGSRTTINALYRNADKALYQAKHLGRNQFVIDGVETKNCLAGYDEQLG